MEKDILVEDSEDAKSEQEDIYYFIELDWFERDNRSFSVLVESRLCPQCQEKLSAYSSDLFKLIAECCPQHQDFITADLPLLEMVFRIFLANSNQPLSLEQLTERLQELLAKTGDRRSVSPEALKRILDNDRYYNIRQTAAPLSNEAG